MFRDSPGQVCGSTLLANVGVTCRKDWHDTSGTGEHRLQCVCKSATDFKAAFSVSSGQEIGIPGPGVEY